MPSALQGKDAASFERDWPKQQLSQQEAGVPVYILLPRAGACPGERNGPFGLPGDFFFCLFFVSALLDDGYS